MNADDTRHPENECPDSAAKLSREFNRCLGCPAKPCEKACPQHIKIREELVKVTETLG